MARTLDDCLASDVDPDVARTVAGVAEGVADLSKRLGRGPFGFAPPTEDTPDASDHAAFDVVADNLFASALTASGVRFYASEKRQSVATLDPAGSLSVALDPLDGSSNIGVDGPVGTIFSIRPARGAGPESFLAPNSEQLAAGYALYGPQTQFILTVGSGVSAFVLDPEDGRFKLISRDLRLPSDSNEYAINASNRRRWPAAVLEFIEDCEAGVEGSQGSDFTMRWMASLVAETHRILTRGGLFLYPGDSRLGYARGRLRMLYECAPIAMLIEQAGGASTDGERSILERSPSTLHERTPFVFGSADRVHAVTTFLSRRDSAGSPLFGRRGLRDEKSSR